MANVIYSNKKGLNLIGQKCRELYLIDQIIQVAMRLF